MPLAILLRIISSRALGIVLSSLVFTIYGCGEQNAITNSDPTSEPIKKSDLNITIQSTPISFYVSAANGGSFSGSLPPGFDVRHYLSSSSGTWTYCANNCSVAANQRVFSCEQSSPQLDFNSTTGILSGRLNFGRSGGCQVTLTPKKYRVDVLALQSGRITSNDGSINCSGNTACTAYFPFGSTVIFTATPNSGSFVGDWGFIYGSRNPCSSLAEKSSDTCRYVVSRDNNDPYAFTETHPGLTLSHEFRSTPNPATPNPPAGGLSCTIASSSAWPAFINGQIPQDGSTIRFQINPPAGAWVERFLRSGQVGLIVQPGDLVTDVIPANGSSSAVTHNFTATVRNAYGQTGSCSLELVQRGVPANPPPSCSLSINPSDLINDEIRSSGGMIDVQLTPSSGATISQQPTLVTAPQKPSLMVPPNTQSSKLQLIFTAEVTDGSSKATCQIIKLQQAVLQCRPFSAPSCSLSTCSLRNGCTTTGGCPGGCVSTNDGQEVSVAVSVPLSIRQEQFLKTMQGKDQILAQEFPDVIRETIPNAQLSRVYAARITVAPNHWVKQSHRFFRGVQLSNGAIILFERVNLPNVPSIRPTGTPAPLYWVPVRYLGPTWRPDLSVDGKTEELGTMMAAGQMAASIEGFLNNTEAVIYAFPGVYGTQKLINGQGSDRVLGAVSLATDLASFGVGSGITAMGRTVVSAGACRAVVATGAAIRVANAIQTPTLANGVDAALASVEGAFAGVHFVKIVVRNGKGYIKAGSSTIGANTIAAQLGRSLDDIAEGGSGIPCDQLAILGVKVTGNTSPKLGTLLGRGGRAQVYESATDPSMVIKVLHQQPADPRAMITERCRQFSQAQQLGIPTLRETGFLASDGKLYFSQLKTSPVNPHDPNFKAVYDAAREKLKCSTIFVDVDNPNNWGEMGGSYFLIDP